MLVLAVRPERVKMFHAQLEQAVAAAKSRPDLDYISRLLWKGYGEGLLTDSVAEAITAAIEARKLVFGSRRPLQLPSPTRTAPKRPRSANRQASLERRRKAAVSGLVPARLAAHFTMGELAVLAVVAGEAKRRGLCECRTTAQNALRQAKKLNLLTVTERRYRGRASGFNTIRVKDALWLSWLRIGGGFKTLNTTNKTDIKKSGISQKTALKCCRSPSVLVYSGHRNGDIGNDDFSATKK